MLMIKKKTNIASIQNLFIMKEYFFGEHSKYFPPFDS